MLKVAICTPSLGHPKLKFVNALNNLTKPRSGGPLVGQTLLINLEDRPVDDARRLLTQDALQWKGVTHILWVDDDMVFPPDALQRLLAHDLDIVGGLCFNRRAPAYQPIVAREYDPTLAMPKNATGFVYDLPRAGVVECDATGGAFLLVKVQVFRDIAAKFGSDSWWTPDGEASEDFSFCRRARACGYKIHVDCSLEIGHIGEVIITRREAEALRTQRVAPWVGVHPGALASGAPRVTVVIPTYNQKPMYLKAAVLSALNQTVPTEVIVVDDGTTDYELRSELVMQPHFPADGIALDDSGKPRRTVWISQRAKLVKHDTNRGISAALNTGVAHMTTDYFCWLSSDDLFSPDKVEKQLNAMLASDAKASFHDYTVIDNTPESFGRYVIGPTWASIEEQLRQLRQTCLINGSTVMIHRDVFAAFIEDPFDLNLKYGQDWEAWLRIATKFLWLRIPESLGCRREDGNLTSLIAASPEDDPRRKRRDEEDQIVRERYTPVSPVEALRRYADARERCDGGTQFVEGIRAAAEYIEEME
jgi:glycosyltransferase involved in cell wall biosynthesis